MKVPTEGKAKSEPSETDYLKRSLTAQERYFNQS